MLASSSERLRPIDRLLAHAGSQSPADPLPATVRAIVGGDSPVNDPYSKRDRGHLVVVRPCRAEGEEERSYVGLHLGSLPMSATATIDALVGIVQVSTRAMPAILVPALGEVVYGPQCWWRRCSEAELADLREGRPLVGIQDGDIRRMWGVLGSLFTGPAPRDASSAGAAS